MSVQRYCDLTVLISHLIHDFLDPTNFQLLESDKFSFGIFCNPTPAGEEDSDEEEENSINVNKTSSFIGYFRYFIF